jgi:glycosyltransferase involved in cell wall biosynthesis
LARALRIAFFSTTNANDYTGGRYHALIMAHAAAAAGHEVYFLCNATPVFAKDLADIDPRAPLLIRPQELPPGDLDYLVVVPTGIFHPDFYESALDLASERNARIALVNFETSTWFNALSPVPRDPRLWDDWRRLVVDGGLVFSSARVSDRYARDFYGSDAAPQRFEIWHPAINSPAAPPLGEGAREGVAVFVRSTDAHKGGADLLALDPACLQGATLNIVSGGDLAPDFVAALAARYGDALRLHVRVSDAEKFRLLARCKALLFPSRFEGFGYPPAEAAYSGAEIAAYDLEVLRETVGAVAHFAPVGDVAALGAALRAALAAPDRPEALRAAVSGLVGFAAATARLNEALWRNLGAVPRRGERAFAVSFGPGLGASTRTPDEWAGEPAIAPLIVAASCRRAAAGDILLHLRLRGPERATAFRLEGVAPTAPPVVDVIEGEREPVSSIYLAVAETAADALIVGRLVFDSGREDEIRFMIRRVAPASAADPSPIAIDAASDGTVLLRFSAESGVAELHLLAEDAAPRPIAPDESGRFALPIDARRLAESGQFLCLGSDGELLEICGGYPPSPAGRPGLAAPALLQPGPLFELQIANVTGEAAEGGVLRRFPAPFLGRVICVPDSRPCEGDIVRLQSGEWLRVRDVHSDENATILDFDLPVTASQDAHPGVVAFYRQPSAPATIDLRTLTNEMFWSGVWVVRDCFHRRGVLLAAEPAEAPIGALLTFPHSGARRIVGAQPFAGGALVWLDAPIGPWRDGCASVKIDRCGESVGAAVSLLSVSEDGAVLTLAPKFGGFEIARGATLGWSAGATRMVREVIEASPDRARVRLDAAAPDRAAQELRLDSLDDLLAPPQTRLRYHSDLPTPGLDFELLAAARRRGLALPREESHPTAERPRVLFLTPVPMLPMNQGNRVVTFRLVAHLLELGFDVDVVLQGSIKSPDLAGFFGERVRVFSTHYPDWKSAPVSRFNVSALKWLDAHPPVEGALGHDRLSAEELLRAASCYHPYFTVTDETAQTALALFRNYRYDSIVCNYTHMARVLVELEALGPLPPTAIVTHDALSRLPLVFDGERVDTSARYCRPEMEREALDAIMNAVVVAISDDERRYFEEIGVVNRVILCEYDGLTEARNEPAPPEAFDERRIIFHGSANPMNVAALDWFLESCWPEILAAVPDAVLTLCGPIAAARPIALPNVEPKGDLSRQDLLSMLRHSTVAINPTVIGTGLKIKTVEACCLGLPSVCLPRAVDGLEDVAHRFAIVARSPADFTDGCVALLRDRALWKALRESALGLAQERFSSEVVYEALDEAMGWKAGMEARRMAIRAKPAPEPPLPLAPSDPERRDADLDARSRAAAGLAAARARRNVDARALLDRAVLDRLGRVDVAVAAGDVALALDHPALAAAHGAAAVALDPARVEGYHVMARAFAAGGMFDLAEAALLRALQVDHYSPATVACIKELIAKSGRRELEGFIEPPIPNHRVFVGERRAFSLGNREAMHGWSFAEGWGQWTQGREARLRLQISLRGADAANLQLNLALHAAAGGTRAEQTVVLQFGEVATELLIVPRDGVPRNYVAPLPPAALDAEGCCDLLFWHGDPAKPPSAFDQRLLGVAVSTLSVEERR